MSRELGELVTSYMDEKGLTARSLAGRIAEDLDINYHTVRHFIGRLMEGYPYGTKNPNPKYPRRNLIRTSKILYSIGVSPQDPIIRNIRDEARKKRIDFKYPPDQPISQVLEVNEIHHGILHRLFEGASNYLKKVVYRS